MITEKEKRILIALICDEQTHMIRQQVKSYESEEYKDLEKLKVKVKDLK